MRIDFNPTVKLPKANFLSRVKLFFTSKTPPLENDSFEKDNQEQVEEPKKTKKLVPRRCPNWCDYEEDYHLAHSYPAQKICYYPEDVEKMEHMTEDEMVKYKDKLYEEGKYTYAEPMTREEFIADMHRYGIDIEKYMKNRDKKCE